MKAFGSTTLAALAGAFLLSAGPAGAQSTATLTGGGPGGSEWVVVNDAGTSNGEAVGGSCDDSPGLAIGDAALDPDGANLDNAYDHGQMVFISWTEFDEDLMMDVDRTQVFISPNPPGTEVAGGEGDTFLSERQIINGVDVTVEYRAVGDDATMRTVVAFFNPDEEPVDLRIDFVTNLGSDANTTIEATSSGDTDYSTEDRWVVTSDDGADGDPVVTHVLFGPGDPRRTPTIASDEVFACSGTEGILSRIRILVPAQRSRFLLFFNELNASVPDALANTEKFDTNPVACSDLVVGLSLQELREVLNWDFDAECRMAGSNKVILENARPKLRWKWANGEATTLADYGDPLTDTGYGVCLFESRNNRQIFVTRAEIPAGEGWKARGDKGFKYKNREGVPDGITRVVLKTGTGGKAKFTVKGRDVELPGLPLHQDKEFVMLLANTDGQCWEGRLLFPPKQNDTKRFKDKDTLEDEVVEEVVEEAP